jgi:hypothetical protein
MPTNGKTIKLYGINRGIYKLQEVSGVLLMAQMVAIALAEAALPLEGCDYLSMLFSPVEMLLSLYLSSFNQSLEMLGFIFLLTPVLSLLRVSSFLLNSSTYLSTSDSFKSSSVSPSTYSLEY